MTINEFIEKWFIEGPGPEMKAQMRADLEEMLREAERDAMRYRDL